MTTDKTITLTPLPGGLKTAKGYTGKLIASGRHFAHVDCGGAAYNSDIYDTAAEAEAEARDAAKGLGWTVDWS
jgi:hypothetical protein